MEKRFRFPGPKSFTREESTTFFGRDEDIANICTSVVVNPTTLLFGKSGTGKSSLIEAGLIPALMKRELESGHADPYLPVRVNPKPYDANRNALCDKIFAVVKGHVEENNFLNMTEDHHLNSLWYLLKQYQFMQVRKKKSQVILLIFDQAEELFTYPDIQVNRLVSELSPVIGQFVPEGFQKEVVRQKSALSPEIIRVIYSPIPVKLIFAIRSDKLHLMTRLKKASPHILQNSYELLPLRREQAYLAMDGPSQLEDESFISEKFIITDEAKEYIFEELSAHVDDMENDSEIRRIEPFGLQIICSHIEQKVLPFDADKVIHKDEISNPREIINGYYLDCINNLVVNDVPLSEQEKNDVRVLIEEKMLSKNRRIPIHQDIILKYQDCRVSLETLKVLVEARILKKNYDSYGESIYEITHDYLIRTIQDAMDLRLGKTGRDKSNETIQQLLTEIEHVINDQSARKNIEQRNIGSNDEKKQMNVVESNVTTLMSDDLKLSKLYKQLGEAYYVTKEYEKSVESFEKALASLPGHDHRSMNLELYKARSDAYFMMGQYEKSSEDIKKILEKSPDDYTILNYLLEVYDKGNKLEEALAYLKENKISNLNAGIFTELGNKYFAKSDFAKARECYAKTLELNPFADYAFRNMGLVEKSLGNHELALENYQKSLELNPQQAVSHNDVGNIYYALQDFSKAREAYLKAVEIDPAFHYAYHNLGLIEKKSENMEEALKYFQKAVEIKPDYERSCLEMAQIYFNSKDFEKSREYYLKLIEADPANVYNYHDMGLIEERLGNAVEAMAYFNEAIKLNPDYALAWYGVGRIQHHTGKIDEAVGSLLKALELNPESGEVSDELGRIYFDQKNWEEAKNWFSKAMKLDPENNVYHTNLGAVLVELGNLDEAMNHFDVSIRLKPGNPNVYFNLGELYEKQNEPEKAIENYKKCLQLDPDDKEAAERLAVLDKKPE